MGKGFFKKLKRGTNKILNKGRDISGKILHKGIDNVERLGTKQGMRGLSQGLGAAGQIATGAGEVANLTGNPQYGQPLKALGAGLGASSKIAGGVATFLPNERKKNNSIERAKPSPQDTTLISPYPGNQVV